jgi:hypothetical protein
LRIENSLDYVGFVQPLPSPWPVSYTCSDDFETKFSPEAAAKKKEIVY